MSAPASPPFHVELTVRRLRRRRPRARRFSRVPLVAPPSSFSGGSRDLSPSPSAPRRHRLRRTGSCDEWHALRCGLVRARALRRPRGGCRAPPGRAIGAPPRGCAHRVAAAAPLRRARGGRGGPRPGSRVPRGTMGCTRAHQDLPSARALGRAARVPRGPRAPAKGSVVPMRGGAASGHPRWRTGSWARLRATPPAPPRLARRARGGHAAWRPPAQRSVRGRRSPPRRVPFVRRAVLEVARSPGTRSRSRPRRPCGALRSRAPTLFVRSFLNRFVVRSRSLPCGRGGDCID